MTSNAVVGVFNDAEHASKAVEELGKADFPRQDIRIVTRSDQAPEIVDADSLQHGYAIVLLHTTDGLNAQRAARILHRMGAVDVEARIPGWPEGAWVGHNPGVEPLSEDELRREREFYATSGRHGAEWKPETERERQHAGDEPGTLWPHEEAHDIGESLVENAAP